MRKLPYKTVTNMTLAEIQLALSRQGFTLSKKQASKLRREAKATQESLSPLYSRIFHEMDGVLGTSGVEWMLGEGASYLSYPNQGDPYTTTLFWWRGKYRIGCWGDLVETYDTFYVTDEERGT